MNEEKYLVFKLVTGEEIVAQLINESDHEIHVMFPMVVKHMARNLNGRMVESIVLGPYTHFSADDEFVFNKHQTIFQKELDSRYLNEYNNAVEDFVNGANHVPEPNPEELQELTEKLSNLFRDRLDLEEEDVSITVPDTSKLIH
jgi:hypothetical protein